MGLTIGSSVDADHRHAALLSRYSTERSSDQQTQYNH
jgi:hypothetical protein